MKRIRKAAFLAGAATIAVTIGAFAAVDGGGSANAAGTNQAAPGAAADSYVAKATACNTEVSGGVALDGTGQGLCVGRGSTPSGRQAVWLVVDGDAKVNMAIDQCAIVSADTTVQGIGTPTASGVAVLAAVSPRASFVSIPVKGAAPTVAETFTVEGYDGVRFVATNLPGMQSAHVNLLDANRNPLVWEDNTPEAPSCMP